MPRKNDDFIKDLIGQIGVLIDARNKTLEINLKAHVNSAIKSSEERIKIDIGKDLQETEARIRKDMATKKDLQKCLTKEDAKKFLTKEDAQKFLTKDDGKRLEAKIDSVLVIQHQMNNLEKRVKKLEDNPHIHN